MRVPRYLERKRSRTYDAVYKDKMKRGSGNYERNRIISTENWVGDAVGDTRLQWKFGTCYPNKGGYAGTNIPSEDEKIQYCDNEFVTIKLTQYSTQTHSKLILVVSLLPHKFGILKEIRI